MCIRGMLRATVLLLLIRTWLSEGNSASPIPKSRFTGASTVPKLKNVFDCKNCANESVVHKILDRVLSGYDVRLRPNFGGAPLPVGISMYVSSIEQISEATMDYTITMFFYQTWKDPRLAYHETDQNLTLDYRLLEKLWVPDCYFLNSKDSFVHDMTVENRMFQLHPDGTVRYGIRLTTTAACFMNLEKFPMDKHTCKLEVESYGYTVDDIVLYWEGHENAIQGTEDLHIPQFSFLGKTMSNKQVLFYTGSYERLTLKFLVQRDIFSYLVQVYWPTVLTTAASWVSFWMNYECPVARVTVGLTSMLILNTINSHLQNKLPQFSCIKAIDIYMVVCFFFVFLSLLEYVYINYVFYGRRGSRRLYKQRRRARRIMARYRYRGAGPKNDQVTIEHESSSSHSGPVRARLASPENLSSLSSISKRAPLASSESFSSLSSTSRRCRLATQESLNDLSSSSDQCVPQCDIYDSDVDDSSEVRPVNVFRRAEERGRAGTRDADDPRESISLDKTHDRNWRHLFDRRQKSAARKTISGPKKLDDVFNISRRVNVKRDHPDVEKNLHRDDDGDDSSWERDSFRAFDEEKDSDFGSDDSSPPSPGQSCGRRLVHKIFRPRYIPNIDRWCQVLFPLAFVLFNIVYWGKNVI
ncbi:gamma-aminobutyric acid receptor subunit theta [Pteropus alecto]|uniref:gamma-aminobutyric acid receptor subunit theta n=1 Tax=Pteropus alecto TaxID=9402 RepID=UPI0003F15B5E|nr:gamma-aminobutyric acid receptor subunit theta [Pteropus alecto]